jgi:hypothetical protein
MDESNPAPNGQTPIPPVTCECGAVLGCYETGPDGRQWLRVGSWLFASARGICTNCKREFHFMATDKQLDRLIDRLTQKP